MSTIDFGSNRVCHVRNSIWAKTCGGGQKRVGFRVKRTFNFGSNHVRLLYIICMLKSLPDCTTWRPPLEISWIFCSLKNEAPLSAATASQGVKEERENHDINSAVWETELDFCSKETWAPFWREYNQNKTPFSPAAAAIVWQFLLQLTSVIWQFCEAWRRVNLSRINHIVSYYN